MYHNFVRSAATAFIRAWFNKPFEKVNVVIANNHETYCCTPVHITYKNKRLVYTVEEWRLALEMAFYKLALGGALKHVIQTKLEFLAIVNMIKKTEPMELN